MFDHVCFVFFTWSFALYILQMQKEIVSVLVILKKYLTNPGILGNSVGTWTPYIWRMETIF